MSYILDALEKSEKKQRTGKVPDLQTVHADVSSRVERRQWWIFPVIGLLVLQAVAVLWWLRPWQENKVVTEQIPAGTVQELEAAKAFPVMSVPPVAAPAEGLPATVIQPAAAPGAISVPARELNVVEAAPVTAPAEVRTPLAEPETAPIEPVAAGAEPEPVVPHAPDPAVVEPFPAADSGEEAAPLPEVEEPPGLREVVRPRQRTTAAAANDAPADVPDVSALPPSVRNSLPALSISYHAYAHDPASRLVSINGRILRQGQAVDKDLVLEEITPSGIILRYNDEYRFRVGVF